MKYKNQEEFEFVGYKVCSTCKVNKTLGEFYWQNKSRGNKDAACKVCRTIQKKKYRKENPEGYRLYEIKIRYKNRQGILEYMLEHPCIICGEDDPVVLEFDHRNPSEKCFTISDACSQKMRLDKIMLEVKKCDVLCANCHRRKTAKDRGYYNHKVLNEGFKYNPNAYEEFKAEMVE